MAFGWHIDSGLWRVLSSFFLFYGLHIENTLLRLEINGWVEDALSHVFYI
jgi:hypothetical protein